MKLVSGPALCAPAKSYGCFPLEGTVSKEWSLIWEGEEASGRERRAKGNTSNTAFVVPENKTPCLKKQAASRRVY